MTPPARAPGLGSGGSLRLSLAASDASPTRVRTLMPALSSMAANLKAKLAPFLASRLYVYRL